MGILPPLQATLNFVIFIGNLINLKQFNTILVIHDQTTRNQINLLIETLPSRCNVAWLLVNEEDESKYWNQTIVQHQNLLILTALQNKNIYPILTRLYKNQLLKRSSKNLIVSSDISKSANELLSSFNVKAINAVLVDWTLAEVGIYASNPYSAIQLLELNETEFLWASSASRRGKYTGLFFDQLQGMQGSSLQVMAIYDSKNVYNVVSKDSVASVDGTEIQIVDFIGNALQSNLIFYMINAPVKSKNIEMNFLKDFLERTYRNYAPIERREIVYVPLNDALG